MNTVFTDPEMPPQRDGNGSIVYPPSSPVSEVLFGAALYVCVYLGIVGLIWAVNSL